MTKTEGVGLAIMALMVGIILFMRHAFLQEQLKRHNAEAALDTSRIVFHDSLHTVSERLAFQQTENITLAGDQKRLLSVKGQQTQLIANLHVRLDSLANVISTGQVTQGADSTIRELAASLDTAGFHVALHASVPPPPSVAKVRWSLSRDPVEVVAALNRDADGRLALRAMTGPNAVANVDTVRVRISNSLGKTRTLAGGSLLLLVGVVLGKLWR